MPPYTTDQQKTIKTFLDIATPEALEAYRKKTTVGTLNSANAESSVQSNLNRLNQFSPTTAPNYVAPPAPPTTETKFPTAVFTNQAGQTAEYSQAQLDDPATQQALKDGGFVMQSTTGPSLQASAASAAEKKYEDAFNQWQSYNVDADPTFKLQADQIRAKYGQLINEMKQLNQQRAQSLTTLGLRTGATQYAGAVQSSIESGELTQANQRIADLVSQEASAISAARNAYQTGKYEQFSKQMDYLENIRDSKVKELENYNKQLSETLKTAREKMIQSSRDSAVADLINQGITDPAQLLDFLNFDERGNPTGGDFTSQEIADTLKNLSGSKTKELADFGADAGLFDYAKKSGWLPENATIFDYWQMEAAAKKSPSAASVGSGTGTLADYEQFSQEQVALSVLPTQLKNSENELSRALQGIRAGLRAGKTPYEVADALTGYMITQPTAFSDGLRKYASLANLQGTEYAELARLVNAGQNEKAISFLENKLYPKIQSQMGEQYVSEADVTYVVNKVDEINQLLGKGWIDEVGVFSGSLSNFISRKFGFGQATAIKAKITSLTADLINKRAGSALTEAEWDRLVAANVPAMNESGSAVKVKMQELIDNPMSRLNAERTQFELPTLDRSSLKNRSLRVPLYSSQTFDDPLEIRTDSIQINSDNPLGLAV